MKISRPEGPLLIALPKDQFASTPLEKLRGELIKHFASRQKATCDYLLLTGETSEQVPPYLVVAEQWAKLRPRGGTILEEVQKAEIDLMHAAEGGEFPGLLWISDKTSVERLDCFGPGIVEEIAADVGVDPRDESENTTLMTAERFAHIRSQNISLLLNEDRVWRWRGLLWAPRDEVVKFLQGCGVNSPPDAWLRTSNIVDPSIRGANNEATASPSAALTGRGKKTEAIEVAIAELFSKGMPPGMSSTDRDDLIFDKLKLMDVKPLPSPRTIQRTIEKLNKRRD